MSGPHIFLIAGEPSGDALGGRLMSALLALGGPQTRFSGVGGERMAESGLRSLFPMEDLTHFGLLEVLPQIRNLKRRMAETVAAILESRPDIVVTIDSPGFTVRVARRVRAADPSIPLVHYVAPTVWAWKPKRARMFAEVFDHLLALLPFEPPWFEREGLPCTFVGHSVVESGAGRGDGDRFRRTHRISADAPVISVLPGSRRGEVRRLLPVFGETLAALRRGHGDLVAVVPTVAGVRDRVTHEVARWPVRTIVLSGEPDKYDAFAASRVALAASGTVALELALARVPSVIGYRMNPVTAFIMRRLVKVKYANLVNLMLDRELVPELLLGDCRADRLAPALETLMENPSARDRQTAGVAEVAAWLGQGGEPPSHRAARAVLACLRTSTPRLEEQRS